jgi:hypothetical protein
MKINSIESQTGTSYDAVKFFYFGSVKNLDVLVCVKINLYISKTKSSYQVKSWHSVSLFEKKSKQT